MHPQGAHRVKFTRMLHERQSQGTDICAVSKSVMHHFLVENQDAAVSPASVGTASPGLVPRAVGLLELAAKEDECFVDGASLGLSDAFGDENELTSSSLSPVFDAIEGENADRGASFAAIIMMAARRPRRCPAASVQQNRRRPSYYDKLQA